MFALSHALPLFRRDAMELRHAITDDQWDNIKDALPGKAGDNGQAKQGSGVAGVRPAQN